jgi:hypothetical protein
MMYSDIIFAVNFRMETADSCLTLIRPGKIGDALEASSLLAGAPTGTLAVCTTRDGRFAGLRVDVRCGRRSQRHHRCGLNHRGSLGDSEVPRVRWSRFAGILMPRGCFGFIVLYSVGVSISRALWRRFRLWKTSRYSKIALASSRRVFQRRRLSSSTCIRPRNDAIAASS